MEVSIKEAFKLMRDALKEERARISEELYAMQKSPGSHCSESERSAYNKALREAAEKIIAND